MDTPLQKIRIGLLWHSMNSDNLGVGALTLSQIAILKSVAADAGLTPQFVVLGWTDPRPHYFTRPDIEVVGLRLKDFVKPVGGLFSRLRGCDVVIDIGAGDSFADIYGTKRISTILAAKFLTLLARRPMILAPQTVGPFSRAWVRKAALATIQRMAVVTTRDDLSTDFLRDLGYKGEIVEASDVAMRLPFTAPDDRKEGPLRVGLNVSGLLMNGGYTGGNMFNLKGSYADMIRALLARLSDRDDLEVHLVPHVISDEFEVEDDHRANLALKEEYPGVVLAPKFADPSEAKTYIANLDVFAGARMHACIAAFSSGVPVLPMAYSRKFAGLFGSIGYDLIADCREDEPDRIIEKMEATIRDREAIKSRMEASLKIGLARLKTYEDAIVDVFSRFVEGERR